MYSDLEPSTLAYKIQLTHFDYAVCAPLKLQDRASMLANTGCQMLQVIASWLFLN